MKYLLFAYLCLLSVAAFSQDRSVSGKITGKSDGAPIPGASVMVKGKGNGTVTGPDGKFSITVPAKSTLLISTSGYLQKEVSVGNSQNLAIELIEDVQKLNDVVVIGYGTQKKIDMTGAASTVKGDKLAKVPVSTFDAALQGRAPGVQVSQQGGSPGGAVRIQIRGTSSVSSGTEPLYVVDGMIIYQDIAGITDGRSSNVLNPLATINPGDIESVELLKDAAATAIYGSRGANGVVLITTKTGHKGQARSNFDFNKGFNKAIKLENYATGSQWLSMVDQARTNTVGYGVAAGQEKFDPLTLVSNTLGTQNGASGTRFGPGTTWTRSVADATNTNWRDLMIQDGSFTDVNFSSSNGFDKGGFFISGQYRDEDGIITNHKLQRYTIRSNLDFAASDKLKVGAKLSFTYLKFQQPQLGIGNDGSGVGRQNFGATGGWGQVNSGALPIMPVYNADGTYFEPLRGRNTVSGSDLNNFNSRQYQNRFLGNMFLDYQVIPSLSFRTELSADFLNSNSIWRTNDVIRYLPVGQEQGRYISSYSTNGYFTYNKKFGTDHEISATAGAEMQLTATRRQDYAFEGVSGNGYEIGEISSSNQFITAVSGILSDSRFTSYFGRANYKYQRKYLLGLSFRRDGSTAFGPNNRYGNFPAVSGGWIISNENFFQKSSLLKPFNFLKARASYGQTGNANITSFAYLNNYASWPVYGQSPGYGLSSIANPNIGWEKNNQLDLGIEFATLSNKLRGSIGYFNRVSKDMLLNVAVSPSNGIGTGSSSVITNIGDLRNRGFELELNTTNIELKNGFRWNTDMNFTLVKNKILRLSPQYNILPTGSAPTVTGIVQNVTITKPGGTLGAYYLAQSAGLDAQGFETVYEIDKNVLKGNNTTVRTGNILRATSTNVNNNKMVMDGKSSIPTWYGAFTNTFSYKGFELLVLLTFQGGNYLYDALEEQNSYVRTGTNVIRAEVVNNSWTPTNKNAKYPILTWNMRDNNTVGGVPAPQTLGSRTDRFLYKADFIRMKTIQFSYNLPSSVLKRMHLQNLRVYANVQNLFTITSYPGYDPEYVYLGASSQDRNLSQGFISAAPVPQVRTFNTGISIGL
jgi:TonB-linked SusC/RagA family outer membrane protein